MENQRDEFDLSKFIVGSLLLQDYNVPQVKNQYNKIPEDPMLKLLDKDPLEILGFNSFSQPRDIPDTEVGSIILEFYRGLQIFITGGTGFLGKVLIEKLIRSVPHLGQIYLLIRPKKGKTSNERFEELFEDKVFLRMKTEKPHYKSKITMLDGDLSQDDLGLRKEDSQLLRDKVHVVFHSAADVRFVNTMRAAVNSNVLGSKRVLDLAKTMKSLKSYVHVSTAYSNCIRRVIEEKCYTMNTDYKEFLKYIEERSDEEIEREVPRLLQGWPNVYTFTKAICENMILDEGRDLPICVFRPSVVWATYNEPVKTWTDNIYGPNGLLLAIGLGVLHIYKSDRDIVMDTVPVDFTVNAMIAVAWENATDRKTEELPVYNYTSYPQNAVLFSEIQRIGNKWRDHFPMEQTIWYTSFIFTTNETVYTLGNIILHKIPGFVLDTMAQATGRQPRLMNIYRTLSRLKERLEFFLFQQWEFKNQNTLRLWTKLSEQDKEIFNFDITKVNFEEYFLIGKLGIKYFYLKESLEKMPDAQRKLKWLKWAHYFLKAVSGLVVIKLLVIVANLLPI